MGNARVHMIFNKDTSNMVRRAMDLLRGVLIGTLYKLLGSNVTNESNNLTVSNKGSKFPQLLQKKIWYGIDRWHTPRRKSFDIFIEKVWSKTFLITSQV